MDEFFLTHHAMKSNQSYDNSAQMETNVANLANVDDDIREIFKVKISSKTLSNLYCLKCFSKWGFFFYSFVS